MELIYALQVPARLARFVALRRGPHRLGEGVVGETAVLGAAEVLALQLEVVIGRVAVRSPFQDAVEHPQAARPADAVGDTGARGVDIRKSAVAWRRPQVRQPGLPREACTGVASEVSEEIGRAKAVLVGPA